MRTAAASLLAVLSFVACRRDGGNAQPPDPAASSAPPASASAAPRAATDDRALDATARRILKEIATLETTKDVTCWTSFRQLDSFIATAQYSNFATLAKIAAAKALVRGAWEKASRSAKGAELTREDVRAAATVADDALAEKRRQEIAAYASTLGMKAYKDYRTTSEHWRVLLAVVQEEMVTPSDTGLRPLSEEALVELADLATRLSLVLLQTSGKLAQEERSPLIEGSHVKRAHAEVAKSYGLANQGRLGPERPAAETVARVAPLTRELIRGKIDALQTFNKDSKDLLTDMNRVAKPPLTADGLEVLTKALLSFSRFVSAGYEPMQGDNFLAEGSFPGPDLKRRPYVDAARAEHATLTLFPHVIQPNGDVRLRYEPNPGMPAAGKRKAEDVLMLDYQQNAVRDTAVHWIVLERVYAEAPFAMDPFAAEYVSEVLSMIMTRYLAKAGEAARAAGAKQIDAKIAAKVFDPALVMVMPRTEEAREWSTEQWQKKTTALASYPGPLFEDTSRAAGLPAEVAAASEGAFDIQHAMGAGTAVGDVDGDGYPDLFLAGEGLGKLLLNRGKEAPGTFRDVSAAWGVPGGLDDAHGVVFFDLEGDGDLDLLVLRSRERSLLLRQVAPGKLEDAASTLGLALHKGAHAVSVFDYDRDGDLDVYVGYYGAEENNRGAGRTANIPTMDGRNGSPNELWRQGPDGRFAEVGKAAGVADPGWTLATGTFDYDNDGDLDLFLANDFGADVFYRNKGDGTFEDVAHVTGTDDRGSGMNVSFTDVNGDGWLDLYVTNIDMFSKNMKVVFPTDTSAVNKTMDDVLQRSFQYLSGNKLFVNPASAAAPQPFAPEQAARFEPGDRGWGWAALFFDYENDGDDDMYLSNGWIEGSTAAKQRKQMFVQDGGVFYLAPPTSPEAMASNGRSVVAADVDRDGLVDLVLNNFRAPPALFRNTRRGGGHWLGVRLRGAGKNSRAVGARVTVAAAGGGRGMREVSAGLGYLGQDDDVLHFGLGKATTAEVTVRWPDGKVQKIADAKADAILDVKAQ